MANTYWEKQTDGAVVQPMPDISICSVNLAMKVLDQMRANGMLNCANPRPLMAKAGTGSLKTLYLLD